MLGVMILGAVCVAARGSAGACAAGKATLAGAGAETRVGAGRAGCATGRSKPGGNSDSGACWASAHAESATGPNATAAPITAIRTGPIEDVQLCRALFRRC